jgi:hypothetical protein
MDVLNIGVGLQGPETPALLAAAEEAQRHGVLTVSPPVANGGSHAASWLPGAFRVDAAVVAGKYDYFYDPGSEVQFLARGNRQLLRWGGGEEMISGSGLAAAHISAILVLILEAFPGISQHDLSQVLLANSLKDPPQRWSASSVPLPPRVPHPGTHVRLVDLHDQQDLTWVGSAVIYPFNKEMHSLVRGRDLLRFGIHSVVDVPGGLGVGKDCSEVIGGPPTGITVSSDLRSALVDADTLVLGYLDQVSAILQRDVFAEALDFPRRGFKPLALASQL